MPTYTVQSSGRMDEYHVSNLPWEREWDYGWLAGEYGLWLISYTGVTPIPIRAYRRREREQVEVWTRYRLSFNDQQGWG